MIKALFTFSFLAVFGTYGLGLAGVLDDPDGNAHLNLAQFDLAKLEQTQESANRDKQESSKPDGHYTLKAMR